MTENADLLIEARWIIPVEPAGVVLENHALAIRGGRILALLPAEDARLRFTAKQTRQLPAHVLIPGLINLHTHAAMSLLRGYGDDLPLMEWLQKRIWPAEGRHVSHEFVRDGTLLACAEMLRGGITCFSDMYFHPEAAAEAALACGMRAALGMVVIDFPTSYAHDAEDYIARGLAIRDRFKDEPLLSFTMAPHAPYTVSDATFSTLLTLAEQTDLPIHIHIHETRGEVEQDQSKHGIRPLERLHRLGLLSPAFIGVHAVHVETDEIALLAEHGCSIAHCPTSNLKLASGIAPVAAMHAAGINIGLGTDGAASNNRLDLFSEMRLATLLAKGTSGDARVLDAHTALRMATLNGARALGLENRIGTIEVGKEADLCAIRLDALETLPCFDPASHLVHAAGRENVSHVWVGGRSLVENSRLTYTDTVKHLEHMVSMWQNKLRAN